MDGTVTSQNEPVSKLRCVVWSATSLVNRFCCPAILYRRSSYVASRRCSDSRDQGWCCASSGIAVGYQARPASAAIGMSDTHLDSTLLQHPWPPFLDWLYKDWRRAAEGFADFAYRVLKSRPSRLLSSQATDDQDDLIQRTILHFIEDECRILKTYQARGRPFRDWFVTVAQHKMMDIVRQASHDAKKTVCPQEDMDSMTSNEPDPSCSVTSREAIRAVTHCLGQMKLKCRILIRAFYDGLSFPEMAVLIGLQPEQNKKASDDLGYCLKKLRTMLDYDGYALSDF